MKIEDDFKQYVNYKEILKTCYTCKYKRQLSCDGTNTCKINIINKDTRQAKYLVISLNGVCDLWENE